MMKFSLRRKATMAAMIYCYARVHDLRHYVSQAPKLGLPDLLSGSVYAQDSGWSLFIDQENAKAVPAGTEKFVYKKILGYRQNI